MLGRSWCPCSREAGIARCCRHGRHYVGSRLPEATPTPWRIGVIFVHSVLGLALHVCRCDASDDPPEVHPRAGLHGLGAGARAVRADRLGGRALRSSGVLHAAPAAATAGRSAGRWPSWSSGWGPSSLATSSGLAAYDTTLLSVHMVQHMVLSMVVPLALALGAPVTLALRTLPRAPAALAAGGAALAGRQGADLPAADVRCSTSSRRGRCTSPAGTTPRCTRRTSTR